MNFEGFILNGCYGYQPHPSEAFLMTLAPTAPAILQKQLLDF